jgi:hypothetical protein
MKRVEQHFDIANARYQNASFYELCASVFSIARPAVVALTEIRFEGWIVASE